MNNKVIIIQSTTRTQVLNVTLKVTPVVHMLYSFTNLDSYDVILINCTQNTHIHVHCPNYSQQICLCFKLFMLV